MLGILFSAVMDTAARNYGNVCVLSDMEIVIDQLLKSRLRYNNGDMNALVLVPALIYMSIPDLSSFLTISMFCFSL